MKTKKTTRKNPMAAVDTERSRSVAEPQAEYGERLRKKNQNKIPYEPRFPAQNITAELGEQDWEDLEACDMEDGRFVLIHRYEQEDLYQNDSPEALRSQAIADDWEKENYYIIDLETMQPYQNNPIIHGRYYSHQDWQNHKEEILQEFRDLGFASLFINESFQDNVYIIPNEEWKEAHLESVNSIREDEELMDNLRSLTEEK